MKKHVGVMLGALLFAGVAAAQQLPGVEGHPESALVDPNPVNAAAGNYELDITHTSVIGRIYHGNLSFYTFRFNRIEGSYSYDPAHPEATAVEVIIDPTSVDSNLPGFDQRLAGPDFLDSEQYPVIKFVSSNIERTDMNHGTMTGDLSFHGVTRPITLDVTFNGGGPVGRRIGMGFSATAHLNVADYGMDITSNNIVDGVSLIIETEFVNQELETDVEQVQQLQSQP